MFTRTRSNSTSSLPAKLITEERISDKPNSEQSNQTMIEPRPESSPLEIINNKVDWQRDQIPTKRNKRKETSPIQNDTNKKLKNTSVFAVPTQNSFEILNEDTSEDNKKEEKEYIPKPEPIFVTGVLNITSLKEVLNEIVDNSSYTMTTLKSGHIIKIMPKDIQVYKTIREKFIANNISHYTYQLKCERAYRVVVRGLHASEDTAQIAKELSNIGHEVRQVVNVRHRATKEPLPTFYVDLEPKSNNKDIFKVKYLNNMKITIEAPYKKKEILQCKRCQRFGHSKNQCYRPFRCVKCGKDHPTSSCTKKPDTEATCANCEEKHPASYKGCSIYKQYKERILKSAPKPKVNPPSQNVTSTYMQPTLYNRYPRVPNLNKTYAEATKAKLTDTHFEKTTDLNDIMKLMETMLDKQQKTIMTMVETMVDKMMDRMVQLVSSLVKK
ncbi:unnamed protein product [Colias eurytheme]|nr:unnamed protein product [Colias eurytheme]